MAQFELLGALEQSILETVKDTLLDPQKREKVRAYRKKLETKIHELRMIEERAKLIGDKQKAYLSTINTLLGPSSNYGTVTVENDAKAQMKKKVTELFTLLHTILDFLSQGKTATTEYAIYYNTEAQAEAGQGAFVRAQVKSKDLYAHPEVFTVTPGGVYLQKSQLLKLFKALENAKKITYTNHSTDNEAYRKIAEEAMKAMVEIFHSLDAELQQTYETVSKEHVGEEEWKKYQYLKSMATWESKANSEAMAVYRRYTMQGEAYGSLRQASFNRGHIGEAYERYLQGGGTDYAQLFKDSQGNLPWFAGGDVGTTQVKTLFSDKLGQRNNESDADFKKRQAYNKNPAVRVASMDSILGLAVEILTLLYAQSVRDNDIKRSLKEKINNQFKEQQLDSKIKKAELAACDQAMYSLLTDIFNRQKRT